MNTRTAATAALRTAIETNHRVNYRAALRTFAAQQPTNVLIDAIEDLEDRAALTDAERISYAVLASTVAKRLGMDARTVAASVIGPAATFRTAIMA